MSAAERLATPRQVAEWLQCSERTLRRKRDRVRAGDAAAGPPWIEQGRSIRYSWLDVHKWAASHRIKGRERG